MTFLPFKLTKPIHGYSNHKNKKIASIFLDVNILLNKKDFLVPKEAGKQKFMGENFIKFVDVTNRDGVQTSRLGLAKLQKTIINIMLNDMGINQSEFGFPTTEHEKHI